MNQEISNILFTKEGNVNIEQALQLVPKHMLVGHSKEEQEKIMWDTLINLDLPQEVIRKNLKVLPLTDALFTQDIPKDILQCIDKTDVLNAIYDEGNLIIADDILDDDTYSNELKVQVLETLIENMDQIIAMYQSDAMLTKSTKQNIVKILTDHCSYLPLELISRNIDKFDFEGVFYNHPHITGEFIQNHIDLVNYQFYIDVVLGMTDASEEKRNMLFHAVSVKNLQEKIIHDVFEAEYDEEFSEYEKCDNCDGRCVKPILTDN